MIEDTSSSCSEGSNGDRGGGCVCGDIVGVLVIVFTKNFWLSSFFHPVPMYIVLHGAVPLLLILRAV